MARREVGIWGSYHYGNFGDDLMAELFARQVRSWGHEPVVFSTNPHVVSPGIARVLPDLADWRDGRVLVIGGGAMLSSDTWIEYLLRPATKAVEREFAALLAFCRRHSPAVIPISIGGGGTDDARVLGSRASFFEGPWARQGTVRLRGDLKLLNKRFGKTYEDHPDVLFGTARLLGRPNQRRRRSGGPLRVGINLHRKRAVDVIAALAHLGSDIETVPVTTHSSVFPTPYEWGHGGPRALDYQTLDPFLDGLASLDLIVSDKLHVGLVGATLGVPFLSYMAKAKTAALHRELGVGRAVAATCDELVAQVRQFTAGEQVPTLVDAIVPQQLDEAALGHLQFLQRRLAEIA